MRSRALTYIHTIQFEGAPFCGKSTLKKMFDARTSRAFITHEGGPLAYMVESTLKQRRARMPASVFCKDLKHTLTVFIETDPLEIKKRYVDAGFPRFDVNECLDLYERAASVLKYHSRHFITVKGNCVQDKIDALSAIRGYIKPREFKRINKFVSV